MKLVFIKLVLREVLHKQKVMEYKTNHHFHGSPLWALTRHRSLVTANVGSAPTDNQYLQHNDYPITSAWTAPPPNSILSQVQHIANLLQVHSAQTPPLQVQPHPLVHSLSLGSAPPTCTPPHLILSRFSPPTRTHPHSVQPHPLTRPSPGLAPPTCTLPLSGFSPTHLHAPSLDPLQVQPTHSHTPSLGSAPPTHTPLTRFSPTHLHAPSLDPLQVQPTHSHTPSLGSAPPTHTPLTRFSPTHLHAPSLDPLQVQPTHSHTPSLGSAPPTHTPLTRFSPTHLHAPSLDPLQVQPTHSHTPSLGSAPPTHTPLTRFSPTHLHAPSLDPVQVQPHQYLVVVVRHGIITPHLHEGVWHIMWSHDAVLCAVIDLWCSTCSMCFPSLLDLLLATTMW